MEMDIIQVDKFMPTLHEGDPGLAPHHHWHVTCDISQKPGTGNGIIGQNINKYLRSPCHPLVRKVGCQRNLGCIALIKILLLNPIIIKQNRK